MYEVLRADKLWQQAGAYYVRIQGMGKAHQISLREEFDEHDGPETRYIVILDGVTPVATCRIYELSSGAVMLGRLVVLPEYRGQGLGRRTITEAEQWAVELGYQKACLESRVEKVSFYEKLGYTVMDETVIHVGTFDCIAMSKMLIE